MSRTIHHHDTTVHHESEFARSARPISATVGSSARVARGKPRGASWWSWCRGGENSLAIIAMVLVLALTGCGKKPRNVDPPEGTNAVFPRVYPPDPDNPTPQKAPDPSSVLRSKI